MKEKDWQAAIAAYAVLFLAAETAAAPLAVVIAWGIPLVYFTRTLMPAGGLTQSSLAVPS